MPKALLSRTKSDVVKNGREAVIAAITQKQQATTNQQQQIHSFNNGFQQHRRFWQFFKTIAKNFQRQQRNDPRVMNNGSQQNHFMTLQSLSPN